jgi:peroxiredoxin
LRGPIPDVRILYIHAKSQGHGNLPGGSGHQRCVRHKGEPLNGELVQATLEAQLRTHLAAARRNRNEEVNEAADDLIDSLRDATRAASLKVGDTAPDFALPDASGRLVRLSQMLTRGPVILTFYRGGWCPYCNLQLRAYERVLPDIRALSAELVAVSPQLPDGSLSTVERNQLPPRIVEYYLGKDEIVDLGRTNGDDSWELPVPGTFVVEPSGRVVLADVDPDYTHRAEPQDLLDALSGLSS